MYKLSILQYPSGRFGFVGSVPIELCRKNPNRSLCGAEYVSKVFNTLQEAQEAQRDYELAEFDKKINALEVKAAL